MCVCRYCFYFIYCEQESSELYGLVLYFVLIQAECFNNKYIIELRPNKKEIDANGIEEKQKPSKNVQNNIPIQSSININKKSTEIDSIRLMREE